MNLTEKQQTLKRVEEMNIEHDRYKQIHEMLDALRPDSSLGNYKYQAKHLFIFGESGSGKTTLVQRYAEKFPSYDAEIDNEGTVASIKPVVVADFPNPFTIVEFYQTIVRALGAPQQMRSRIGDVKRQVFTLLREQRVEMLILDEANSILSGRYVKLNEAMEAIKHVSNMVNVSIVMVGTPESRQLVEQNFQYFRRFPSVELQRFEKCDEEFCNLLKSIDEQISPLKPIGLGDPNTLLPEVLHHMSGGLLGALTPILQFAYRKMLAVGGTDTLADRRLLISALEFAQRAILGDDEEKFTKMLHRSEMSK
ncbi:TniB family NTP-binding protein [Alicyclobacillus dauci]|uniref:TniB family NTP-binding protein n=1 Tax=Alicyclobacillus dauci TaxID=1475485 RepID=A0ABY6Z3V8_9BACL|nr:TniB family NTP-binding protein [Alicyclobacillus dauci]WAH37435.1 TniB family NTP-binding protein [Alicyclobacillus dauci]